MNVGVNYMREHVISDARIHYAYLDNGGEAPNVVQDHASLLYFMRAPKLAQSSEILARIKKIAQGAALMTETEVKVRVLGGLSDVIPNPTAFQVLSDAYVEMGGPEFDEEDYAIARKFLAILPEDAKKAMVQKMAVLHKMTPEEFEKRPLNSVVIPYSPLMRQKVLTASSDVGDVSYLVPTGPAYRLRSHPRHRPPHLAVHRPGGHLHRRKSLSCSRKGHWTGLHQDL